MDLQIVCSFFTKSKNNLFWMLKWKVSENFLFNRKQSCFLQLIMMDFWFLESIKNTFNLIICYSIFVLFFKSDDTCIGFNILYNTKRITRSCVKKYSNSIGCTRCCDSCRIFFDRKNTIGSCRAWHFSMRITSSLRVLRCRQFIR